jgi:hypothetical protein
LALAFLFVILTLTTVLAGQSFTTTVSLQAYRNERTMRYMSDGALQNMIQYAKANTTTGITTAPAACAVNVPMVEDTQSGAVASVVTAGSVLMTTCAATSGVSSGGTETDGGQALRDVIITVRCVASGNLAPRDKLNCAASGSGTIVAQARVRFDISPDPNGNGILNEPAELPVRAIVPKIVWWHNGD